MLLPLQKTPQNTLDVHCLPPWNSVLILSYIRAALIVRDGMYLSLEILFAGLTVYWPHAVHIRSIILLFSN